MKITCDETNLLLTSTKKVVQCRPALTRDSGEVFCQLKVNDDQAGDLRFKSFVVVVVVVVVVVLVVVVVVVVVVILVV